MKKALLTLGVISLCAFSSLPAFANKASKESCPEKKLGESTIEGKYIKETPHEGYYGFLVKAKDGKSYDIGIGNDVAPQFEGIKAGNSIKIPFYTLQFFDKTTGTCVTQHYLNYEGTFKGSFTK